MPKKYPTFSLNVTRKVNSQRPQNYWLKSKHSVQSDAIALPETHMCSCHTPVWDMAWHTGTCASMRSAICMPSIGYWHAQYRLLACPVYAEIDCWLECWTFDQKFASSNPGRSGERIFFSSQLCVPTLIRCPFHPRVTAVARKRLRSICKKMQVAGYT